MPANPASPHKCCGARGVARGRGTTTASRVAPSWLTSCRLAPITMSESGMPCPSTNTIRLLPFFSPVGRVGPVRLESERGLHERPINALPAPGDAFHVVVLGQSRLPQGAEHASL